VTSLQAWKMPKAVHTVDRRSVAYPAQARTLLQAVGELQRSGPRLVAFYACLYNAGLRPEEAAALNKRHLDPPEVGWGWLHLDRAEPHAGKEWTDSGKNRDRRQLKQRERGEPRNAPCPGLVVGRDHRGAEDSVRCAVGSDAA
jgi:integrase